MINFARTNFEIWACRSKLEKTLINIFILSFFLYIYSTQKDEVHIIGALTKPTPASPPSPTIHPRPPHLEITEDAARSCCASTVSPNHSILLPLKMAYSSRAPLNRPLPLFRRVATPLSCPHCGTIVSTTITVALPTSLNTLLQLNLLALGHPF